MRKFLNGVLCLMVFVSVAQAQEDSGKQRQEPTVEPASASDTVRVSVHSAPGKNQFRLDVFVVNSEPVAGMPTPVRVSSEKAKMQFDSVSYVDGRVEYFQLKTHNADTASQTLLIGLIADLSGSKPPLKPGRGKALSVFYTADAAVKADDVNVEPVVLPPANKMEFNTIMADGQIGSTIPTFVQATGKPAEEAAEE